MMGALPQRRPVELVLAAVAVCVVGAESEDFKLRRLQALKAPDRCPISQGDAILVPQTITSSASRYAGGFQWIYGADGLPLDMCGPPTTATTTTTSQTTTSTTQSFTTTTYTTTTTQEANTTTTATTTTTLTTGTSTTITTTIPIPTTVTTVTATTITSATNTFTSISTTTTTSTTKTTTSFTTLTGTSTSTSSSTATTTSSSTLTMTTATITTTLTSFTVTSTDSTTSTTETSTVLTTTVTQVTITVTTTSGTTTTSRTTTTTTSTSTRTTTGIVPCAAPPEIFGNVSGGPDCSAIASGDICTDETTGSNACIMPGLIQFKCPSNNQDVSTLPFLVSSNIVCMVCTARAVRDPTVPMQAGNWTGEIIFGPNMISRTVNEEAVEGYRVYVVDKCGMALEVNSSVEYGANATSYVSVGKNPLLALYTHCCSADAYRIPWSFEYPDEAESLMVVPYGRDPDGSMWVLPGGVTLPIRGGGTTSRASRLAAFSHVFAAVFVILVSFVGRGSD